MTWIISDVIDCISNAHLLLTEHLLCMLPVKNVPDKLESNMTCKQNPFCLCDLLKLKH